MSKHRRHSVYDFRGYDGTDIDIGISLKEYGIAWKKISENEYKFIYGVDVVETEYHDIEYSRFDWSIVPRRDWDSLQSESWYEADRVAEFAGISVESLAEFEPYNIYAAIQYHGSENILGSSYYSFEILG